MNNTSAKAYNEFFAKLAEENQLQVLLFGNCVNFAEKAVLENFRIHRNKLKKNLKIVSVLNGNALTVEALKAALLLNEKDKNLPELQQLVIEKSDFEISDFEELEPLKSVLRMQFKELDLPKQRVLLPLLKKEEVSGHKSFQVL